MGQSIRYCKEKDINNLTNIIDEQLTETNQLGDKELIFKNLKKNGSKSKLQYCYIV